MSKPIFKTDQDRQNYDEADRLFKNTLQLVNKESTIGIVTDKDNHIMSYELVIDMNSPMMINFSICLTSYELLEKTKLFHELFKESVTHNLDIYQNCLKTAQSKPKYRSLIADLYFVVDKMKYLHQNKNPSMPSQRIH